MEVKKSRAADLERGWTQRMLLGTMVALAVLFVGLEITITPDDPLDDPELLARLETEMELPALMQQEEEMTAAVIVEPKPTTKLVVVDEMEQMKEWMRDDELMETDLDEELEELAEELREMEPPPSDEDAVSLRIAEDAPQFPGGPVAMMKWLTRNLHYPKALEPQHVQGKVVAEFIVNEDGSIAYVKVTSGLHPLCDAEVLRVLRMMPRWKPGVMDGEPCRTKVCVPVVFKN